MSLETNQNILLNSIINYIDKTIIVGNTTPSPSIILLSSLIEAIEYSTKQYNSTKNKEYLNKIKILNKAIQELKYRHKDICTYKDRFINN